MPSSVWKVEKINSSERTKLVIFQLLLRAELLDQRGQPLQKAKRIQGKMIVCKMIVDNGLSVVYLRKKVLN